VEYNTWAVDPRRTPEEVCEAAPVLITGTAMLDGQRHATAPVVGRTVLFVAAMPPLLAAIRGFGQVVTADAGVVIHKEIETCLNKLKIEAFDQLSTRIQKFLVSDLSRAPELVRQIFEKAIDEEFVSAIYAKLCSSIALAKTETGEEVIPKFRKMLLDCCQKEFEKATAANSLASTDKMEEEALKLKVGADPACLLQPPYQPVCLASRFCFPGHKASLLVFQGTRQAFWFSRAHGKPFGIPGHKASLLVFQGTRQAFWCARCRSCANPLPFGQARSLARAATSNIAVSSQN
jgi:hypothetical protein